MKRARKRQKLDPAVKQRDRVISTLREHGHRITKARTEIVDTLLTAKEPLSIQQVVDLVSADETSVYRTFEVLLEHGLIEEINAQGNVKRYAVAHGHHHHIVCTDCGYVAHVPCDDTRRKRVRHPVFREIVSHEVTYYGTCSSCK